MYQYKPNFEAQYNFSSLLMHLLPHFTSTIPCCPLPHFTLQANQVEDQNCLTFPLAEPYSPSTLEKSWTTSVQTLRHFVCQIPPPVSLPADCCMANNKSIKVYEGGGRVSTKYKTNTIKYYFISLWSVSSFIPIP